MRRAALAVAGTAAGLVALLAYKSGPAPQTLATTGSTSTTESGTGASTAPGSAAGSSAATGDTTAPTAPATSPPTTPATTAKPGTRSSPATSARPRPTAAPTTTTVPTRTVTGADEQNRYGDVQVRLTMQGSHIVDVQALQMPMDRQRSAEISQEAGPQLRQEVLEAQSANIDVVSGATYTSDSYAASVQSALDQAK